MALRVDLADKWLGEGDLHCLGAGDHDLTGLLFVLLLALVKIRLILADDVFFRLLGAHANGIKVAVNLWRVERGNHRVERRNDVAPQLRQPQDAATYQGDEQHEGFNGSPHGEYEGIHSRYSWPA